MHGSLSHYRLARLIKYSFYKNILFCFMLFFFQFYCGYSGACGVCCHMLADWVRHCANTQHVAGCESSRWPDQRLWEFIADAICFGKGSMFGSAA